MNRKAEPAPSGSQTYTIQELSQLLGLSLGQTYKEAKKGIIPHLRFGKRYVFPRAAIDRWMADAGNRPAV